MNFILPRKYLSYSAITLWNRSPNDFRKKYYFGEKLPESRYSIYGREVHEKIESGEIPLPEELQGCVHERRIMTEIEGVPIMAYIDLLREDDCFFVDTKTGIYKDDGSPRWTQLEVEKHEQLPFYSLLIKNKYGKVNPKCSLWWLVTDWEGTPYDTKILSGKPTLKLTGERQLFTRRIYQSERERMKQKILQAANEIHNDYEQYRNQTVPEHAGQESGSDDQA